MLFLKLKKSLVYIWDLKFLIYIASTILGGNKRKKLLKNK